MKWQRIGGPIKQHLTRGYIKRAQDKMREYGIQPWSKSCISSVANDKMTNPEIMKILLEISAENICIYKQ